MPRILNYKPRTQKEIFDAMIIEKRTLAESGETSWTSEAPGDPGISLLNLVAFSLSNTEKMIDTRLKQSFLSNAIANESVIDGSRSLGLKLEGPIPAKIKVSITASGPTNLPLGTIFIKKIGRQNIKFFLLERLEFSEAETKDAYVLQVEASSSTSTGTGEKYQKVYLSSPRISRGSISVRVNGALWKSVPSFKDSDFSNQHYSIEQDYSGRTIIYFGNGIHGLKPSKDSLISCSYLLTRGDIGTINPGELYLYRRNPKITTITNTGPSLCTLKEDITPSSTTIETEDGGGINGFTTEGIAYVDLDSFTYTGISGNDFTGVSGLTYSHLAGEDINYTLEESGGSGPEWLETPGSIKSRAFFKNRIKSSATSALEYAYVVSNLTEVSRAYSYAIGNTIFIQVIPREGTLLTSTLKTSIKAGLKLIQNARHRIIISNPSYVYIDITLDLTLMPSTSFDLVRRGIQNYFETMLNPHMLIGKGKFYTTNWGSKYLKEQCTLPLYAMLGGRSIQNIELVTLKRSSEEEGCHDIELLPREMPVLGTLTLNDVSADHDLPGTSAAHGFSAPLIRKMTEED